MGAQRGHYEELGVAATATLAEIRTAYVALARRHHPDRLNGSAEPERAASAARMARVNAAWTVLSDPTRRAAYDARLGLDAGQDRARSNVRDPDSSFRPFDDGDDIDPRLLDDTPSGAPTIPRALAFVPTGLAAAGVVVIVLGAMLGLVGVLVSGFFLMAMAGLSFLALPLVALISASRNERD